MRQLSRMMQMNIHLSQTRTRLVDSLISITFSLENNVFSVLHYVINTICYIDSRFFQFFLPLEQWRMVL